MGYAAVKTVASVEALFTEGRALWPHLAHREDWDALLTAGRAYLHAWGTSSSPRPMPPGRAPAMSRLRAVVLALLLALSLPFGLSTSALGAVAFDAATAPSNSDASSSTTSYTHTPVGTPTAVAVTVISTGARVSSLTYGWANMTFLQSASPGSSVRVEQWGLANPFPGAQTVRATVTGGPDALSSTAVTFTGSGTTVRTAFRAKATK